MEQEVKKEPLDKELQQTLEEPRTVITGLQALFGFQLIVPFHPTFKQLGGSLKAAQLGALLALGLAIALIMTPTAYHRLVERGQVSRSLIDFASRLIARAMASLTIAIALNMCLVGSVVLENQAWVPPWEPSRYAYSPDLGSGIQYCKPTARSELP